MYKDYDETEIEKEAFRLIKDGKASSIEEAKKKAVEMFSSYMTKEETMTELEHMKDTIEGWCSLMDTSKDTIRRILSNAINHLEGQQEVAGEVLDTSKVIFILEQKGDYPNAYYVKKIYEEVDEFNDALINGDKENQKEEWLDMIQIVISTGVEVLGFSEGELWDALAKHNKKLLVDRNYKVRQVAIEFKGHDDGLTELFYDLNKAHR
jgi:intracellular sulfur oxidation DsrE/DsrF family protein